MNLADYVSELLGQRSAVSVPGLGYFEKVRVDGYYNDSEAIFYPPRHQVKFKPETSDDDTFAEYIARKKNISLASAKYFIEKFISKLKEDAADESFQFSGLGSFRMENGVLIFTPNDKISDDPSFYGYEAIGVGKPASPVSEPAIPVFNTTEPPVNAPVADEEDVQQHYVEEEEEIKRTFNVWSILMAVIVVAAIAVFAAYKYDPSIFDRFNSPAPNTKTVIIPAADSAKEKDNAADSIKKDSIKSPVAADSTKNAMPAATALAPDTTTYDTLSTLHYVIRVVAFKKQKDADDAVKYYKSLGLDAKLQPRTPRRKYKVIVGRYTTRKAAELARLEMVKAKKISKDSQTIKIDAKK